MRALAEMRRSAKEKELNALLSGDNDSCSCFIEVYCVSFSELSSKAIAPPCIFGE